MLVRSVVTDPRMRDVEDARAGCGDDHHTVEILSPDGDVLAPELAEYCAVAAPASGPHLRGVTAGRHVHDPELAVGIDAPAEVGHRHRSADASPR